MWESTDEDRVFCRKKSENSDKTGKQHVRKSWRTRVLRKKSGATKLSTIMGSTGTLQARWLTRPAGVRGFLRWTLHRPWNFLQAVNLVETNLNDANARVNFFVWNVSYTYSSIRCADYMMIEHKLKAYNTTIYSFEYIFNLQTYIYGSGSKFLNLWSTT